MEDILNESELQRLILGCLQGRALKEDELAEYLTRAATAKFEWNCWQLVMKGKLTVNLIDGKPHFDISVTSSHRNPKHRSIHLSKRLRRIGAGTLDGSLRRMSR